MSVNHNIHQLLPAPGFRAFECAVMDDGVEFREVPVIGWAVMRPIVDPEQSTRRDEFDGLTDDRVQLYVWSDENREPMRMGDLDYGNTKSFVLPPGQELTDELKAEFERETREQMAYEERRHKRRELIRDLYDQGMSQAEIIKTAKSHSWEVTETIKHHIQALRWANQGDSANEPTRKGNRAVCQ